MSNANPFTGYVFPAGAPSLTSATVTPNDIHYLARAEFQGEISIGVALAAITQDSRRADLSVSLAEAGVARVVMAPQGHNADSNRLARPQSRPQADVEVSRHKEGLRLSDAELVVNVHLDPFQLEFARPGGHTLLREVRPEFSPARTLMTLPLGFSESGDRVVLHESFYCEPDEHFYGFGEKFTGFDKRGQWLVMWNEDSVGVSTEKAYKNVPFFVSTRGYGIFVDSVTSVNFDLAASNHQALGFLVPDEALDFYVITGPDLMTIVHRYSNLVGRPTLPPKWAFGLWVSSSFKADSQADALERQQLLRANDIPSDVIHLDCYWQRFGHWSDMRWDLDAFPDPPTLIRETKAQDFKLSLWINPHLTVGTDSFQEAASKGYLLKSSDGQLCVLKLWADYHPPVGIVDFTNPDAVAWWKGLIRPLLKQGADVLKTDFGEGVPANAVAWNGMSGERLHNLFPLIYNDIVSQVTAEETGRAGFVWGRSTYAGGQRHAAQWAGDPSCTYQDMASTLRGGLSIAMCGHAFWSHDIGGFNGQPTPDLFVRWAQFGLLSPLSRLHGTTTRLPWDYGSEALEVFRKYVKLRYRLLPYIYSAAIESAESGEPLMRPMLLEFPDDPVTYALDLQYMFGRDLLIAPVFNVEGVRSIYLPAGPWVDLWSNELLQGPTTRVVHSPLDHMPIYVRGNAMIPTCEVGSHVQIDAFDPVTVDAYLISTSSRAFHDSDGVTLIRARRRDTTLELRVRSPKRRLLFRLVPLQGMTELEQVTVNGRPALHTQTADQKQVDATSWYAADDGGIVVRIATT